ncbi:MAG: SatD family protein, partial [Candidatus Hodarchaeales archaeon]
MFIIITGDIVRSREIPNRAEAQEILKNALYIINRKFESQIQAPFVIVWGDSF